MSDDVFSLSKLLTNCICFFSNVMSILMFFFKEYLSSRVQKFIFHLLDSFDPTLIEFSKEYLMQ